MFYSEKSPHAREPLPAYRVLCGCICLTVLATNTFAQGGGNITGTVKDKSGNPIIGVAVTIPNTARGTLPTSTVATPSKPQPRSR